MKSKYFVFFIPSSPIHYFAICAHSKEDVQYLIDTCSNFTDKPTKGKTWYLGEFISPRLKASAITAQSFNKRRKKEVNQMKKSNPIIVFYHDSEEDNFSFEGIFPSEVTAREYMEPYDKETKKELMFCSIGQTPLFERYGETLNEYEKKLQRLFPEYTYY